MGSGPGWEPVGKSLLSLGLSLSTCRMVELEKVTSRALLPRCSPQPSPYTQGGQGLETAAPA